VTTICLDTSAYSNMRRGHEQAVEVVRRARMIAVPTIVVGELYTGFRLGSRRRENEAKLDAFLREPVVRVLEVDTEAASIYADLVVALRKPGRRCRRTTSGLVLSR
jgi:tRNA(fMet)-specific endonuclease VapC